MKKPSIDVLKAGFLTKALVWLFLGWQFICVLLLIGVLNTIRFLFLSGVSKGEESLLKLLSWLNESSFTLSFCPWQEEFKLSGSNLQKLCCFKLKIIFFISYAGSAKYSRFINYFINGFSSMLNKFFVIFFLVS